MFQNTAGVSSALANAIRQVNAAFNRLPRSSQEAMEIYYDGLDRELDEACASDDRSRALAAIDAWRKHWLGRCERAGK